MPEPMIKPTMSESPFKYVKVLSFSSDRPPSPPFVLVADVGAPIGAYPPVPVVELRGNMFAAKSNAEETEYDRFIRPLFAGFTSSKGSSSTSESRREEDMLGRDDISVGASSLTWLELAKDANSRESR
jgi:hypothetical protein